MNTGATKDVSLLAQQTPSALERTAADRVYVGMAIL